VWNTTDGSILQIATHCNTLQHTATQKSLSTPPSKWCATHCNTPHHTLTHCNAESFGIRHHSFSFSAKLCCGALQCVAVCCSVLQSAVVSCSVYASSTFKFSETKEQMANSFYSVKNCNTLQHIATHCNTLQHTATHCNTVVHNNIDIQQNWGG